MRVYEKAEDKTLNKKPMKDQLIKKQKEVINYLSKWMLTERTESETKEYVKLGYEIKELEKQIEQPEKTITGDLEIIEFPNDSYKYDATKSGIKVITEIDICECGHIAPLGFIHWDENGNGTCVNCVNDILIDRLVKKNKQIKNLKSKVTKSQSHPVQLPTDEEIESQAMGREDFIKGANWILNKIKK
jgi:hypothetical protein